VRGVILCLLLVWYGSWSMVWLLNLDCLSCCLYRWHSDVVCSAGCGIPPVLARIHMQALLCCPFYSVLHILNKAASFHLWKLSDRVALTRICDCIFSLGRVEWPSRLYRHYMWLRLHGTRTLLSVQLQIEDVHTVYIPTVAPRSIRFWRHHTEQPHPWHRS